MTSHGYYLHRKSYFRLHNVTHTHLSIGFVLFHFELELSALHETYITALANKQNGFWYRARSHFRFWPPFALRDASRVQNCV